MLAKRSQASRQRPARHKRGFTVGQFTLAYSLVVAMGLLAMPELPSRPAWLGPHGGSGLGDSTSHRASYTAGVHHGTHPLLAGRFERSPYGPHGTATRDYRTSPAQYRARDWRQKRGEVIHRRARTEPWVARAIRDRLDGHQLGPHGRSWLAAGVGAGEAIDLVHFAHRP